MKSLLLALLAYALASLLFFGDVLRPLWFITFWLGRLGAPLWQALLVASAVVATMLAGVASRRVSPTLGAPVFVVVIITASVLSVGLYAELFRAQRTYAFQPDVHSSNSFFASLREAPKEFQFFLHSAALKDCVPYAWSYRDLAFYRLPPGVAPNVLPADWLTMCSIERPTR